MAGRTAPPRPAPHRPLFGLERQAGWQDRPAVRLEDFTITAAADGATPGRWNAVLVVEGVRTTDHREIGVGALGWRTLPLPFMGLDKTTWGHDGAELCGTIEQIVHVENRYEASGTFLGNDAGQKFSGLIGDQALRWVSVDLEVISSEFIEVYTDADLADPDDWWGPMPSEWWERITQGNIMGATVCPFPAFPQCVVVPEGMAFPAVEPDNGLPTLTPIAAGGDVSRGTWADEVVDVPEKPPASWFADQQFTRLTHVHSPTPGHFCGHVAGWYTPHIGYVEEKFAPPSPTLGRRFMSASGGIECDDGSFPVTGRITMGTGHAGRLLAAQPAADHYDHTGTAIADVVYGEDQFGGWVSGAIRPGTTKAQLRALLASDVSGDWRPFGQQLDLVAVLVVNVPGFPTALAAAGAPDEMVGPLGAQVARLHCGVRRTVTAEGQTLSLVAAGIVNRDPMVEVVGRLRLEVAALRKTVDAIAPQARKSAAAALYERVTQAARPGKS